MDISSDSRTPKSLPLPGTNYIRHDVTDSDQQGVSDYTTLANCLVNEWLNQALDSFELTFGDTSHQSDTCSALCETSNGNHNENRASSVSGDMVRNSTPSLKQLCLKALETLHYRMMNQSVGQFCDEEKQARSKCENGMNENSLNCNLLVKNMPHKQLCHNSSCAGFTEFNASMHSGEMEELYRSKGFMRCTKSATFLHHSVKKVDVESDRSEHLTVCDFSNLENPFTANTGKAEVDAEKNSHKFLQNVDISDETMNQIQALVGQVLPTVAASLNNASCAVEDMTLDFSADVNANFDYTSTHRHGSINCGIISLDPSENIPCKVTHSSSDTVPSKDSNSTDSSSHIFLSGPGAQVSFLFGLFAGRIVLYLLVSFMIIINRDVEFFQSLDS